MEIFWEVLQDAMFHLLDANKITIASGTSIELREECGKRVYGNIDQ